MPAQDVERGGVQLHRDEGQPFEILRPLWLGRRDQGPLWRRAIGLRQIGDDSRAFGQHQAAILKGRDLAPGVEPAVFRRVCLAAARLDLLQSLRMRLDTATTRPKLMKLRTLVSANFGSFCHYLDTVLRRPVDETLPPCDYTCDQQNMQAIFSCG